MKDEAVIIDLDKTLCKSRELATPDMKHWKDFWPLYQHIPDDVKQEWCASLINMAEMWGCKVVFLTGRPEHVRELTTDWLTEHLTMFPNTVELIMMPNDYSIEKTVVDYKRGEALKLLKKYDVIFSVDDNIEVCKMYERIGIKALHCEVKE